MATEQTILASLYTLTPLHMGTGQATGAVDLPVAREGYTGLPIVPATALKGIWRDIFEFEQQDKGLVKDLFGPEMEDENSGGLRAGNLVFTEGHCLALPLRSGSGPFVHATSLLVLERLARNLAAFSVKQGQELVEHIGLLQPDRVYVTNEQQENKPLLVEDLFFQASEVFFSQHFESVAHFLASLLPERESATRKRLIRNLVLLPDPDFQALLDQALPVQARIKLGDNKSASDTGGNLWYEESVPADTLFAYFLRDRPGAGKGDAVKKFRNASVHTDRLRTVQLGGNETVGYGWCWSWLPQLEVELNASIKFTTTMTASTGEKADVAEGGKNERA